MQLFFYLLSIASAARNPLLNYGINAIATGMAEYRSSGVDSASAVSAASALLGSYVDNPPLSSALNGAVAAIEQDVLRDFRNINVPQAQVLELVQNLQAAITSVHNSPDFSSFKQQFDAGLKDFDVPRMATAGSTSLKAAATNTIVSKVESVIKTLTAGPTGKEIVSGVSDFYDANNKWLNIHLPALQFWLNVL